MTPTHRHSLLMSLVFAGNIVDLLFDPESKLLLTLGDRHVRVFHNVAGYHAAIQVRDTVLAMEAELTN